MTNKSKPEPKATTVGSTPGPWAVKRDFDVVANGNTLIVETTPKTMLDMAMRRNEAIANARLIASAPELLHELKDALRLLKLIEDTKGIKTSVQQKFIGKTIAKAEGESNG